MAPRAAVDRPAALRFLGGFSPVGLCHQLRSAGTPDAGKLQGRLELCAFRPLFPEHLPAGDAGSGGPVLFLHAGGLCFRALRVPGRDLLFALTLLQLFILPEVLIVENYRIMAGLGLIDTIAGIGLPYMASAFGIFLLRQAFKQVPRELEDAARVEGCGFLGVLLRVYVPVAKPVYLAYGLVSVSTHWNNFLWPLVVTNSVDTRPLTVGLAIFGAPESGVNWAVISAATLMVIAPLLIAFLLFQRQFVQSFMTVGIK